MIVYVYAIENIRLRDFFPLSSERTEKKQQRGDSSIQRKTTLH